MFLSGGQFRLADFPATQMNLERVLIAAQQGREEP